MTTPILVFVLHTCHSLGVLHFILGSLNKSIGLDHVRSSSLSHVLIIRRSVIVFLIYVSIFLIIQLSLLAKRLCAV